MSVPDFLRNFVPSSFFSSGSQPKPVTDPKSITNPDKISALLEKCLANGTMKKAEGLEGVFVSSDASISEQDGVTRISAPSKNSVVIVLQTPENKFVDIRAGMVIAGGDLNFGYGDNQPNTGALSVHTRNFIVSDGAAVRSEKLTLMADNVLMGEKARIRVEKRPSKFSNIPGGDIVIRKDDGVVLIGKDAQISSSTNFSINTVPEYTAYVHFEGRSEHAPAGINCKDHYLHQAEVMHSYSNARPGEHAYVEARGHALTPDTEQGLHEWRTRNEPAALSKKPLSINMDRSGYVQNLITKVQKEALKVLENLAEKTTGQTLG